jgi:hypothetical protein
MNILAVDTEHMSVYDFLKDEETEAKLLERANNNKQEDIKTWSNYCVNYPNREDFRTYLAEANNKQYHVMTWDQFQKLEKDFYIGGQPIETTEEHFDDMLNCLPPMKWCTINNVEMFCMCEMLTGTYTSQYARYNDKYYTKVVDVMDRSTWINNYIVEVVTR